MPRGAQVEGYSLAIMSFSGSHKDLLKPSRGQTDVVPALSLSGGEQKTNQVT